MGVRGSALLLGALLLGVGALLMIPGERVPDPLRVSDPAPDFALPVLGDDAVLRLSSLRGKVVLVNFWATWCKPCEDEMPAMERLYGVLKPRGFELLAISVDEEPGLVEAFRARLGLTFPILQDPDQETARAYQSSRFPESFIIDADGIVAGRFIGPRDWDAPSYVRSIERLLDARSPGG